MLPTDMAYSIGITLRLRQNGRYFPDDIFKYICLNESIGILINISLRFVPKGPITNIPALVQIMAWRRSGDKPLSEPLMVRLSTHVCITQPQWVMLNGMVMLIQSIWPHFLCIVSDHESKVSANERRHYIGCVCSHWSGACSHDWRQYSWLSMVHVSTLLSHWKYYSLARSHQYRQYLCLSLHIWVVQ